MERLATYIAKVLREYHEKRLSLDPMADERSVQQFNMDTIGPIVEKAVEFGRLTVLEDFDSMCKADAMVGFSTQEWEAVKKFFAYNKQISKWDKE